MTRIRCCKTGQVLGIVYPFMGRWEVRIGNVIVSDIWTREEAETWLEQELDRETTS